MSDQQEGVLKGPRRLTREYFCSIEVAVDCIGGKWKPSIMYHLKGAPLRLAELMRLIPRASKKVLVAQLRELEADGLVTRRALEDEVPKGMEYRLTDASLALAPILQLLHEWGVAQAQRRNITLHVPAESKELDNGDRIHSLQADRATRRAG